MMDCREVMANLAEFIDRELSPEEQAEVKRHLSLCGHCEEAFRWEDSILRIVKRCAQEAEPIPAELEARLSACLDQESA